MKYLIILFVLCTISIFAQIEQRPDQMEQLLWWDLYTTATANGGVVVVSDTVADDNITVGKADTVYARLFVSGTVAIKNMDVILQYGYYHNYHPNSYYGNNLILDAIELDSTALDLVTTPTGTAQVTSNLTSKRIMLSYLNSGIIVLDNKSIMILTFITSAQAGQQILGVPLSTDISPHGYTLRYWTELFNAALKPFSTWVHNTTIVVE